MQNKRAARLRSNRFHHRGRTLESLEPRRVLAVLLPEFVPSSNAAYESIASVPLQPAVSEQLMADLAADQWVSLELYRDSLDGEVLPEVQLVAPDGQTRQLDSQSTDRVTLFESFQTQVAGRYVFEIMNSSASDWELTATVSLNTVNEVERADLTNNTIETAVDLDPYFVTLSEELDASVANIRGAFTAAEPTDVFETSFADATELDPWQVDSSYESGRVEVVVDGDGSRLQMNTTASDPNNTGFFNGVVFYDPATGNVRLSATHPFTAFTMISRSGIFGGERPDFLDGPFDVFRADKLFELDNRGVSELDFGEVVPTGLAADFLKDDIYFETALLGGGAGTVGTSWELSDATGGPVYNSITTTIPGSRIADSIVRFTYETTARLGEAPTIEQKLEDSAAGQYVAISDDGEQWYVVHELEETPNGPEEVELDIYELVRNWRSGTGEVDLQAPLQLRFQQATVGEPLSIYQVEVSQQPRTDWYQFTAEGGDLIRIIAARDTTTVYGPDGSLLTRDDGFEVPAEYTEPTRFYVATTDVWSLYNLSVNKNVGDRNDDEEILQARGSLNVIREFETSPYLGDKDFEIEFENGPTPDAITIRAFALNADPTIDPTPLQVASYDEFVDNGDGSITLFNPDNEPDIVVPEANGYVLLSYEIPEPAPQRMLVNQFVEDDAVEIQLLHPVWYRDVDVAHFGWTGPELIEAEIVSPRILELRMAGTFEGTTETLTIPAGYFQRQYTSFSDPQLELLIDADPIRLLDVSLQPGDVVPVSGGIFTVTYSEQPFGLPYVDSRFPAIRRIGQSQEDGRFTSTYQLPELGPGEHSLNFSNVADVHGNDANAPVISFVVDGSLPRDLGRSWLRRPGHIQFAGELTPVMTPEYPVVYEVELDANESLVGTFWPEVDHVSRVQLVSPSGETQIESFDTSAAYDFSFHASEAGTYRLELTGDEAQPAMMYLARDTVLLSEELGKLNTRQDAFDLTPILAQHAVGQAGQGQVVDLLRTQFVEVEDWYTVTVQPGESFELSLATVSRFNNGTLRVYRENEDEPIATENRLNATFGSSELTEPTTYYFEVLDDTDVYSLTVAKNVSVDVGASRPRNRLAPSLPNLSRLSLSSTVYATNYLSKFLSQGDELELGAESTLGGEGETWLRVLGDDGQTLSEVDLSTGRGELRYVAVASGYVTIELEQLSGARRIILESNVESPATDPVPLLGDFDRSGLVDEGDVRLLSRAATDRFYAQSLDLNDDETVDRGDMLTLLAAANTVAGDINLDGVFNDDDLAIVATHLTQPWLEASWQQGDQDFDGRVTTDDLIAMFQAGGYQS